MNPTLVALLWIPCASASYQAALSNETVIYSCPNTVQYIYQSPRAVTEAPAAATPKQVAVKKKAAPKKKYRKRKKRR